MKKFFKKIQNLNKPLVKTVSNERSEPSSKSHKSGVHSIYNPIEGDIVNLNEVPDTTFSGKMLGDGFAIFPTASNVYSPADGEVVALFPTNHALVILTEAGLEILIHIGIDTASLNGDGFTAYVEKGAKVKKGELLLTFDTEIIDQKAKSLFSPVIITNMDIVKDFSINIGNKKALEKVAEFTLV